ncbi:PQQ-binding-like beta-propeller repeat protein [Spongisporangium articulatum]|uniref:PQQ-binding-like beta-propeller repeat protein n=1 Tax=Spongisporangium articulatum TaxID=3362603 RepID=A0ABW8AT32_9ACTN
MPDEPDEPEVAPRPGLTRRRLIGGAVGAVGLAATGVGGWFVLRPDDGSPAPAATSPTPSGASGAANWQTQLPGLVAGGLAGHGALVVDEQSVYVVGNDAVWALDRRSGARLWQASGLGGNLKVGARADDVLVLTADPTSTVALDLVTGKTLWRGTSGGEATLAAVPGATDVVGTTPSGMARRAVRAGRPVWTLTYPALLTTVPQLFVTPTSAVSVGSGPTVVAVEAAGGKVLWRRWLTGKAKESGKAPGTATPTWSYADEAHVHVVFTPTQTDFTTPAKPTLVTLETTKGKELWRTDAGSLSAARIPEGLVVTDESRAVALLDPATGERRWRNQSALKLENAPPLVVGSGGGVLVLRLAAGLLALEVLTGEVRWFQPVTGAGTVTVAGDRVVATVTGQAVVRQWRLADGVEGEPLKVAAEAASATFTGGDAFVATLGTTVSGFPATAFTVLAGAPAPLRKATKPSATPTPSGQPSDQPSDQPTAQGSGVAPTSLQGEWAGVITTPGDYFSLFLTVAGAAGGHTFRATGALSCTVPFTVGPTSGGKAQFAVQAATADCPKSFTLSGGTGEPRRVTYTDDQGHKGRLTYVGPVT